MFRIKGAGQRGTMRFFICNRRGRSPGAAGLAHVDPEKVEYSCEKNGFRTVEVMHRRMSRREILPVENRWPFAKAR